MFLIVGPVVVVASYLLGQRWQGQIRELVGADLRPSGRRLLMPLVAVLVFVGLVAAAGGSGTSSGGWRAWLSRWMGRRAARALGWVVAAADTVGLVSGVLVDGILALTDRIFAVRDATTSDTAVQPTSPLRSGGPGSLVAWDSLGRQGRNFVGPGPTAAEIAAFTGTTAPEPIRAYAGIASPKRRGPGGLAVADLNGPAGSIGSTCWSPAPPAPVGWIRPRSTASSTRPGATPRRSRSSTPTCRHGRRSWSTRPRHGRPGGRCSTPCTRNGPPCRPTSDRKLYAFGLSLGSYAAEAPFSGEADMANRTDGILLAGPPAFNPLNREFTDGRDPGTPEVQPVFRDGRTVRFTNDPAAGIPPVDQDWDGTRVLYLQHASDPVVWLSPDLILHRPDWLAEPPGPDVTSEMIWIPFVTFWQVAADLLEPVDTPPGHGHTYTLEFVDGWAACSTRPAGPPSRPTPCERSSGNWTDQLQDRPVCSESSDSLIGQVGDSTESMFPAGSVNQAMSGPWPRAMPFSSCEKPW